MMQLSLRSTGGFTGPAGAQTRSVDLAQLPPDQAAQLEQLVKSSDFFTLPQTLVKTAPQSWDFQYELKVEDGGQTHSIRYHLDAASPQLQELTHKLSDAVRPV
jgi:hypothetical protein